MALKELLGNLVEEVEIKGVKIKVKPLTLSNIGELLRTNADDLKDLFNGSKGIKEILADMPSLAYNVIALSTSEEVEDIKQLAIGYQLELLEKIVDASQISSDAMGKLVSRLIKGVQTTLGAMNQVMPSRIGKTPSKEQLESSRKEAIASQK